MFFSLISLVYKKQNLFPSLFPGLFPSLCHRLFHLEPTFQQGYKLYPTWNSVPGHVPSYAWCIALHQHYQSTPELCPRQRNSTSLSPHPMRYLLSLKKLYRKILVHLCKIIYFFYFLYLYFHASALCCLSHKRIPPILRRDSLGGEKSRREVISRRGMLLFRRTHQRPAAIICLSLASSLFSGSRFVCVFLSISI